MRQKEAPKTHDKAIGKGKEWIGKVVVDFLDMPRKNRRSRYPARDPNFNYPL
jgi:hypothetical protein